MARSKRFVVEGIQVVRRVSYRTPNGKFVSRAAARELGNAKREVYEEQRTKRGKVIRAVTVLSAKSITKTARVRETGVDAGDIFFNLARTNIFTRLEGAKRFEISVRGKDYREKSKRIKLVIDAPNKKLSEFMVMRIVTALRQRGYRTTYKLDQVTFTTKEWTKAKAGKLKQLHDVEITVRVQK